MKNNHSLHPYIIAETAYNHQGDIKYLFQMIDEIASLGLNAVKFHLLLNPMSYMVADHPLMDQMLKWLFDKDQWNEIIDYSVGKNLDVIALCDDIESLQFINRYHAEIKAVELHASGLNDYFLLDEASKFPKLVILGIGGSSLDEIQFAVEFLKSKEKEDILLMYGFQSYPTEYRTINLAKMLKIRDLFKLPVGYADHTSFDDPNNAMISIAAAFMGISVLEKHYTPEPGKERIDYHAAVGKKQISHILNLMKIALQTHGDGRISLSEPEKKYGNIGPMKKAIVSKRNIEKGNIISLEDLWYKRTPEESTIQQKQILHLIGSKAKKNIKKDEIIDFSKIDYKFKALNLEEYTKVKQ